MGDPKGFLKIKRQSAGYRNVCERIADYCDVTVLPTKEHSEEQASRCMDCGTSFCHWGCPIGNVIPEWNDLVFHGYWRKAVELLQSTNNFPEITGRICPALCEFACVLSLNDDPVTIRENELAIVEQAFEKGYIRPNPPKKRTGKRVAVIGSGPSGLACADQLNKAGHKVTVFERDDKIGGILRYGIPDFKLEKWVIDRRVKILKKEGIEFTVGADVGRDVPFSKLKKGFDAFCLTGGSKVPRDLNIEGRELKGIHFAMDYLIQSNKRVTGTKIPQDKSMPNEPFGIDAKGKRVVVIGGGDTGADCIGVAHRQGATHVLQIELLPRPPEKRTEAQPWPKYPMLFKTSSSHAEGGERQWAVLTKKFTGKEGRVKKLHCVTIEFEKNIMKENAGSEFEVEADLIVLAMGFVHPEHTGLLGEIGLKLDKRGNVETDANYMTSVPGVFSAGDMHRGQSLVVWAIHEGRHAARYMDKYLMGESSLPII